MNVNIDYQLLPVNLPIFIAYFTCELKVVTQYDKNLNGVLTSAVTECLLLEASLKDMNLQVSALIRKKKFVLSTPMCCPKLTRFLKHEFITVAS